MISKKILPKGKIDKETGNQVRSHYDFAELGNYVRDAGHEGEKCLMAWNAGCLAETYDLAMVEIVATQSVNTRTTKDKTYHLVISFRPEDELKLAPETFKEIEKVFAAALGFSDHQRVCGVHRNTNNMHMHIAYNKIHPEKLTIREPYRDFIILAKACKAVEEKYGLAVDNKLTTGPQIEQHAASMEAHSGVQSFQSFALSHKEAILQGVTEASTWQGVHKALARYGLEIKPRGNGLVVANAGGKKTEAIKASDVDRSLAKNSLKKRFGEFERPEEMMNIELRDKYSKKPLQATSEARNSLYRQFQETLKQRKDLLQNSITEGKRRLDHLNEQAAAERNWLRCQIMAKHTKAVFRQQMFEEQRRAKDEAKVATGESMAAIRRHFPFHNWNGYLKWQAEQGNETALQVLRSQKSDKTLEISDKKNQLKEAISAKERQLLMTEGRSGQEKQRLVALNKMDYLVDLERLQRMSASDQRPLFDGTTWKIDNRGVIIYSLPNGGTVRDDGEKLFFSSDEATEKAALIYGQLKFGKNIVLKGNAIERKNARSRAAREPATGPIDYHKPDFARFKQICTDGMRKLSDLTMVRFKKEPEVLLQNNARDYLEL